MAVREIKTTIALDGEQAFNRSLQEMQRNMRLLDSEMQVAQAEFENTGDKQAFLTKKSDILRQKIAQQEEITKALGNAVSDSTKKYGDADRRVDGYRIKTNKATASLDKMRRQLQDTDREVEELGRDADDCGREISDGIADKADEAADKLNDMAEAARDSTKEIAESTKMSAMIGAGQAAVNVGSTIWDGAMALNDFAEESRAYNMQKAALRQNAQDAGMDWKLVEGMMINVTALTGEASASVTGLSSLLDAGFDETQLVAAIDNISGALIRFPGTFSFDGLSESLNETIKTGSAAGEFEELLTNLGYDVEEFNEAMGESGTQAGRMQIALAYLTNSSLKKTKTEFEENNQDMIDAAASSARLSDAWNELGGAVDVWLIPLRNGAAAVIETVAQKMNEWSEIIEEYEANRPAELGKQENKIEGEKTGLENMEGKIAAARAEAMETGDFSEVMLLEAEERRRSRELDRNVETFINEGGVLPEKPLGDTHKKGKEAGGWLLEGMKEALTEGEETLKTEAETVGENTGTAVSNGMTNAAPTAIEKVRQMVDGVLEELSEINKFHIEPDLSGLGAGLGGKLHTPRRGGAANPSSMRTMQVAVNVNMDGHTMARGMTPYVDEMMGTEVAMMNG